MQQAAAPTSSSRTAAASVRRPPCGAQGSQVPLDDVDHRLDDVVVDPGRHVVGAGGDGDQATVLDALVASPASVASSRPTGVIRR